MGRGGAKRKKKQARDDDGRSRFALGRVHSAFLGGVCGAAVGVTLCVEWLEDMELMLPLAGGGAVVGAIAAALVGDKVWEAISDWL